MPKIKANNLTMNYDQQGTGEPLVLIPYLAADHACYAFQVAEYAKHFTCLSLDLRGTGETDKPGGAYSTELFADDVAAFMQAVGIQKAHVLRLIPRCSYRHVAGGQVSGHGQIIVAAQWLDEVGPIRKDRCRRMAGNGESVGKRARDGHSEYLSLVFYARTLC